jgi:hypothetical protein
MLFVIKNKNLLKTYGRKARRRVEANFDQNLLTEKLSEFIDLKRKLIKFA